MIHLFGKMVHLVGSTIHLVNMRAVYVKYQILYGFFIKTHHEFEEPKFKFTTISSYIKLFSLFFDWVKERIVLVTPHL